jgi:SSS family solute:Na+ symporter
MYAPGLCRKSSATWTLLATMVSFAIWLMAPKGLIPLPHPIYFTWIVSLVTFFVVALIDRRKIEIRQTRPA